MVRAKLRGIVSLLLAAVLITGLTEPALAAETAKSMKLGKVEGTVSVRNNSDRELSAREGMLLANGYTMETAAASYVLINLDDTKLVKLDASSKVEIRKSGKNLEVLLKYGSVYVDVSEHLKDDETLKIPTSTATVGIRGTKVVVTSKTAPRGTSYGVSENGGEAVRGDCTTLTVIEGTASMTLPFEDSASTVTPPGNDVSYDGNSHVLYVSAGESAAVFEERPENLVQETDAQIWRETRMEGAGAADIPGFAQTELTKDGDYTYVTASGSEVITQAAAREKLLADQAEEERQSAGNAGEGDGKSFGKKSTNPTWNTSQEPTPSLADRDKGSSRDETYTPTPGPVTPADPGPDTDPDPGPGTEPDPGPGTDPDPDPDPAPDPDPEPAEHTVTFEDGDGNVLSTQAVEHGQTAAQPAGPTKAGYEFTEWYNGQSAYEFSTPVTADLTLVAGWRRVYTLTQNGMDIYQSAGGANDDLSAIESLLASEDYLVIRSGGGNGSLLVDRSFTVPEGKRLDMEAGVSVGLYGGYAYDNASRPGTLVVEGTMNIKSTGYISIAATNDVSPGDASGIQIGAGGWLSVSAGGGMQMNGNVTNNGELMIADVGCELQFSNDSVFTNAGTLGNSGTITLLDCAMTNTGTIQNSGAIQIQGVSTFHDSGTLTGNAPEQQ